MSMPRVTVRIRATSKKWQDAFPGMQRKIRRAVQEAFSRAKKRAACRNRVFELGVMLATDRRVRRLNRDYRGKDRPTNVLSFPQAGELTAAALRPFPSSMPVPLGDVVLALETVKRECRAQGKNLENHVLRLVVHGVLHILGYDHMTENEVICMEK